MSRAHVLKILGEKAETGRFIREQLEGQDLDVVETGKLDQGIQKCHEESTMDGGHQRRHRRWFASLRLLQNDDRLRDIPVVLLSGKTGNHLLDHLYSPNAADFYVKRPINLGFSNPSSTPYCPTTMKERPETQGPDIRTPNCRALSAI